MHSAPSEQVGITEFEFHISPTRISSWPQIIAGTVGTRSRSRCAPSAGLRNCVMWTETPMALHIPSRTAVGEGWWARKGRKTLTDALPFVTIGQ